MVAVWIQSPHNLHCPECGSRLVEQAGRYRLPGRVGAVHVGEVGTLCCPSGHLLPSREELYADRTARGLPWTAAVREVDPPFGAAGQVAGAAGAAGSAR